MERKILLLFLFCAGTGFSQGIRILQGSTDVTGTTVIERTVPGTFYETPFTLYNSESSKKTFGVTRILKNKLSPDYQLLFGVNEVFFISSPDSIFTSTSPFTIEANGSNANPLKFSSFLNTGAICQDILVTYYLFDADTKSDTSEITIHYTCTTGIHKANESILFNVYPNPSVSSVTIDFSLNTVSKSAKYIISDMLGQSVKEVSIEPKQGNGKIVVTDLLPGFYFYQFVIDGQSTQARKLIINER